MAKKTTHDASGKPKILVVEDDSFLAGMYVTKLGLEGFSVDLAGDGKDGLKKAREWKPDLILLDIVLPVMDGFSMLTELKADADTRAIPVMLLTNLGAKGDVEKGLALGAADYLIKAHFMPSEVVEKVKRLLAS
ncbi:MAG: response regulator [Candidatus Kerfeldbacteria bacterium]|nr:response regulator [Candidatus Kerfeldbacteria bacterium]